MTQRALKQADHAPEPNILISDEEMVRRIINGEKDLYALIIRRFNQRLYRIGLSIVNNESVIEDLMQAAYIKAYENLTNFRFQSSFPTWITRIMINECLMHRRSNVKSSTLFAVENLPPRDTQTPLMSVMNTELRTILETTIRRLPDKYRAVFVMRELEQMSIAETMECLGISEANVKIRLNRAKVILRERLAGYINDTDLLPFYKPRCDRMVELVMKRIA